MACKGCNERKKGFAEGYSRRGFIGGVAGLLATVGVQARTALLSGFVPPEEMDAQWALELMRILTVRNAAARNTTYHDDGTHTHVYASKEIILGYAEPGLGWIKNSEEVKQEIIDYPSHADFWNTLDPLGEEIMPGWLFDMDVRPATGYVMILHTKYSPFAVFTSDQTGVIYRAKFTGDALPKANSLDAAGDFPGAVPFNKYNESSAPQ